ncbi:hypothetical protein PoB_005095300 [Plakobranchus ocellatus]|uniref:DUF5641 domain-containing protein n=1 Tax=Plakobranchus ocellatus TaxID=259542 RepID=A0AAV4C042_9GAST|nr:hypothetical protein PoB_005095300 [Plakobranchus ocellatus]
MGRKLKTKLPIASKLLRPKKQSPAVIKNAICKSHAVQQKYYNRDTKSLPPLKTGESVFVRNPDDKKWRLAKVVGNRPEPRSYMVQTSGGTYRRNRRDILKPLTSYAHQPGDLIDLSDSTNESDEPNKISNSPETDLTPERHPDETLLIRTSRSGRVMKTPVRYADA